MIVLLSKVEMWLGQGSGQFQVWAAVLYPQHPLPPHTEGQAGRVLLVNNKNEAGRSKPNRCHVTQSIKGRVSSKGIMRETSLRVEESAC